jgi:hypothetical protein
VLIETTSLHPHQRPPTESEATMFTFMKHDTAPRPEQQPSERNDDFQSVC